MLKIRLLRTGRKNRPFFKIVVVEKQRAPKSGKFIEDLGSYDPLKKELKIKEERIKYWLSVGAKPSPVVHNFLVKKGIIKGKKIPVHKKKKEEKT
jgi:small subunit ribosomal protein S16